MERGQRSERTLDKGLPCLVVDDSHTTSELVIRILRTIGFVQVSGCATGAEALALLRTSQYGSVVTDLEMSPMSGLDLISCIRNDQALAHIPIILMTARVDQVSTMVRQHKISKADIHILKPFTPKALLDKINAKFFVENTRCLK